MLPEIALAKVNPDAPFDNICYIGYGVTTGIGAVINTAKVEIGATDRLRPRSPNGAKDEFHLAAAAQNLRKMAKILPHPAPRRGPIML